MGSVRGVPLPTRSAFFQGPARRKALRLRSRGGEQHDRGSCQPPAQEAWTAGHRDRTRARLSAGQAMRLPPSLQARLGLSLGALLTLLWIAAAPVTAVILPYEKGEGFHSALQETAQRLLPLAVVDILGAEEHGVTQHLSQFHDQAAFFPLIVL